MICLTNIAELLYKDLVETYTSTTFWINFDFLRWPLFSKVDDNGTIIKYTFLEIQSQAATDACVDFLMEAIESE